MKLNPLAVAIGVALPAIAGASTISTSPATVSSEYLDLFGGIASPAATVALGAQYAAGDILTFTYSASPKAGTGTAAFSFANTLAIGVTGTANTAGALALFDSGDNSVSYRVTTAPSGEFGSVVTQTPFFRTADMGGADVTLTASAATSQGTAFDVSTAAKVIDQTGTQFSYAVSGLTQVIDVESARKAFVNGTATAASHVVSVTQGTAVTSVGNTVAPTNVVTATTIAMSITGDFSWLDSSTTATGVQGGNIVTGAGVSVSAVSATQINLTLPAGGATFALGNAGLVAVPTQSLAASLTGHFLGNSTTGVSTGAATGAYSLNGSTVTVYAVPTSSSVSNFIWLTNSGATDGEVSIVVSDAGTDYDLGVVATSAAGTELDITAALNAALEAQGVTLSGGRVHMDIVTKVPASDIAVSAAYRVGDDRVNLITSLETDND